MKKIALLLSVLTVCCSNTFASDTLRLGLSKAEVIRYLSAKTHNFSLAGPVITARRVTAFGIVSDLSLILSDGDSVAQILAVSIRPMKQSKFRNFAINSTIGEFIVSNETVTKSFFASRSEGIDHVRIFDKRNHRVTQILSRSSKNPAWNPIVESTAANLGN